MRTKGGAGAKSAAMYTKTAAPTPGEPLTELENENNQTAPRILNK